LENDTPWELKVNNMKKKEVKKWGRGQTPIRRPPKGDERKTRVAKTCWEASKKGATPCTREEER